MQMSGEQEIEAASKKASHCFRRTAGQEVRFIALWQIERVMCQQDSLDSTRNPAEVSLHLEHLPVIDTAAFDYQSPGRVDAGDRDFSIEVEGLQVIGDVLLVNVKRAMKACIDIIERNVMISGHDDLRCWKCPQKRTSFLELTWLGTLRKIARDGDYIRPDLMNRMNQLFDDSVIRSTEVDIRKMN